MNLLTPLRKESFPIPEDWRPAFIAKDPQIIVALDSLLIDHRGRFFWAYFRNPMEF